MKMLPHCARFCVSMLIVLEVCQALWINQCYKRIISPNSKEIIINEGETLQISCCGTINFIFPEGFSYNVRDKIDYHWTPYDWTIYEDVNNSIPIYTFERLNTIYNDTGWYGCADSNVKAITNFSDPKVNWLYVYVISNRSVFVGSEYRSLDTIVGDSIDIPCRTTSPNLQPRLLKDFKRDVYNEEVYNEEVNNASYNPKFGFTISNLSLDDSGWYTCSIEMDKREYTINVLSGDPEILIEPKAEIYKPELNVNCTAEMEVSVRYARIYDWNTRQQNRRRNINRLSNYFHGYSILVNSLKLPEFRIKEQESNNYDCDIKTNYNYDQQRKGSEMKKIFITYRQKEHDIFSLSLKINYVLFKSFDEIVKLRVVLPTDEDIKSDIRWFKPNDEEIIKSDQKYDIYLGQYTDNIEKFFRSVDISFLEIHSLNIFDTGNYKVQVGNKYMIKNLTVRLDVIDKPISVLPFVPYCLPNETREIRCEVTSNPPPNITWNFLQCPNYPSLKNSTIVHLTNVTRSIVYNSSHKFESTAIMFINVSGKITCKACNEIGCHSVTENIFVSDRPNGFGIIGPKESVMKGDNIELICAASIYNYSYEFTWTKLVNQTIQPLEETGRLEIVKDNISFTHQLTLKLYNVQELDAMNYVCTREIVNTLNHEPLCSLFDRVNYTLVIHEPVPPYFSKTNINQTKTRIIDMIVEGQNILILQCYADGMPKPTVIWYKDNDLLKENDQYFFKYNHQELHIKYFMQHDSGMYLCRAVSRLGINETYQQITVKNTKWHTLDIVLVTSISILGFILITSTISFTIKVREKKLRKELIEAGLLNFEEVALELLNPNLTIDEQAELLPYDKKWEFPRNRLTLREQLGSGNFGVVMKGEAFGISKNEDVTTVAVKMVRRSTDPIYIHALVSELKIMVHLGKHLNVVNLLGACTDNIFKCELLVIVEYCRFGNLHNYLLSHRNEFVNQINPKTREHDFTIGMNILSRNINVTVDNSLNENSNIDMMVHNCPETNSDSTEINFLPDCVLSDNLLHPEWRSNDCNDLKDQNTKPICTQDLLSWAFQVARGMEYLSQRKILHGDLAARNILLAEDNVVKISDFGFAKILYEEDNYKKKSAIPMPIKWMAMESIRNRIFSTQSDIWSFGIVLWELFTLAETPYPNIDVMILHQRLIEGYMEQPDYAIDKIYNIMLQCWEAKPTLRPSFTNLVESIGHLLGEGLKTHYVTLNNQYVDINMMNLENGKDDYLMMTSAPDYAVLSLPTYKCENSFSKEISDSLYLYMKCGCPLDESKIFGPNENHSHIVPLSLTSDHEEVIDLPPTLKGKEDLFEDE